jgi:hypothetical protein
MKSKKLNLLFQQLSEKSMLKNSLVHRKYRANRGVSGVCGFGYALFEFNILLAGLKMPCVNEICLIQD